MEENKNNIQPETDNTISAAATEQVTEENLNGESLGDRVKTLSPGRTVAKRFFR